MSGREKILNAVRRHELAGDDVHALPDLQGDWQTFADREKQLQTVLEFVSSGYLTAADAADAWRQLSQIPMWTEAKRIVSLVPGMPGTVDFESIADPHEIHDVDCAIVPGQFAVCENGAVWIDDAAVKHRAIYFLVQHLAFVVSRNSLVDTMHDAYARLTFDAPRFGAFISGPSKTADIEQSLVIGAHGPRSSTVILLGT